jgi:hypothetical protein
MRKILYRAAILSILTLALVHMTAANAQNPAFNGSNVAANASTKATVAA